MASSSSSSSSSMVSRSNPPKYDVFLSFRGEDTRKNFTSHLHAALLRSRIETFIDDCEVRKGDEISSSLSNAIRSSSLAIIIFSQDYASSSWCLNELLEIIECNKTRGQIILPVFYHVSPADIRKQRGTYGKAFAKHEKRFKKMKDKVQKWRAALTQVANLSGWDLNQHDWSESCFIDQIVADVLNRLNSLSSSNHLDPDLVGIESHIKSVESLLCVGMSDIRIVGIWGMGGIGKTTIASAVYNRIVNQFESSCFLENVRHDAKNGLTHLQEKLFFKILGKQNLDMRDFTINRLSRTKVLIVLDDVDDSEHLKFLLRHQSSLALGSRIIITSRDKQVLKNGGIKKPYKVKELDYHDALKLFSANAFKQSHPLEDHMELSEKFVFYAKGNPLALKVLGSFLLGRTKLEWQKLLEKLKKYPDVKIQNVLRISYDGLAKENQEIFLFIACFFKEETKDRVIVTLDGCGFPTEIGISVLVDRCLLTIRENKLSMHDLIREMGRGIVFQESVELAERSRLWDPQEICNLLKRKKGISAVQSLSLDLSQIREPRHLYLAPDVFTRMPRLKLLKFYASCQNELDTVQKCEGLESLPDELRYLYWRGYPLKSLPSKFNPEQLVELDIRQSNIEYLWKDTKFLENLRRIGLHNCEQLIEVPDLSQATNLEIMELEYCSSLTKFPMNACNLKELYLNEVAIDEIPDLAIKCLNKLGALAIESCTRLKNLPSMHDLTCLKALVLYNCPNFTEFPKVSGEIRLLFFKGTAIEEVPNLAIESLTKLVSLIIHDNTRLKSLPSLRHLTSLKKLDLYGCVNFSEFPEISGKIKSLYFSRTAIEEVPNSAMGSLNELVSLYFDDCARLKNLPSSLCRSPSLRSLNLRGCINFTEFLEFSNEITDLSSSKSVMEKDSSELAHPGSAEFYSTIHRFARRFERVKKGTVIETVYFFLGRVDKAHMYLRDSPLLNLSECNMLVLPSSLSCLSSVRSLVLEECKFESLDLRPFTCLEELDINHCERLQHLQLPRPSRLTELDASHCISLETISDTNVDSTQNLRRPWRFDYSNCLKLEEKAHINVQTDIWSRIQLLSSESLAELKRIPEYPKIIGICFPGSEIPELLSYRNEGSSITIDLPPHWSNNKLVGFVICMVAPYEPSRQHCPTRSDDFKLRNHAPNVISVGYGHSRLFGLSHLIDPNSKVSLFFSCITHSKSDHVFLAFRRMDLSEHSSSRELSFQFYTDRRTRDCRRVKKCGVHLVYLEPEGQITESDHGIANEDQEQDSVITKEDEESKSKVNNISKVIAQPIFLVGLACFLIGLAFSFFLSFKNCIHY